MRIKNMNNAGTGNVCVLETEDHHRWIGVKDDQGWNVAGVDGATYIGDDERPVVVHHLVPSQETITDPRKLDSLPANSIVRELDSDDALQKRDGENWYVAGESYSYSSSSIVPVVLLWSPEATDTF